MGLKDRIRQRISEVKSEVAAQIAAGLAERPESLSELEKLGLVSPEALAQLAAGEGLDAVIGEFRTGILEMIREKPSAMQALHVRPLDLMVEEAMPRPPETDAVTATVLFSDLEGFTRFNAERGDLEATALLRDHYDTVAGLVAGRGGTVVKTIGDGHMLSFVTPVAAVLSGFDLIEAAPPPLAVRVGGHVGPVLRIGGDLLGHAVNLAARVTDLADGGQQTVTDQVRSQVGALPAVGFSDRRAVDLKGIAEPVTVWNVTRGG